MTDGLEKLLLDVRKTINDNREFLRNLAADADQEPERTTASEESESEAPDMAGGDGEEFEEL